MFTRRRFNQAAGLLLADLFSSHNPARKTYNKTMFETQSTGWRMPDEAEPHTCTWMAFGPDEEIWENLIEYVQKDLATIAKAISRFEPVKMLVRPEEKELAAELFGESVTLVEAELNDLWIRDFGPSFVVGEKGKLGAVDLNFNGWGEKQEHDDDAAVAEYIAELTKAEHIATELVGEGGGIEVDGHGTAIVTESCFVNRNRNPDFKKPEIEAELKKLLGLSKIIWIPGIKDRDITDGHTDFYARFTGPGVVVAGLEMDKESFDFEVTRKHLEILRESTDASGKKLEVVTLEAPRKVRKKLKSEDFSAGYINFYVVNGAVIAPEFGDAAADEKCKSTLARLFPKREIVMLNIDAIAAGGGGIHCATQQQPRVG